MNSKQAADRMEEIEEGSVCGEVVAVYAGDDGFGDLYYCGQYGHYCEKHKKEAKEIYEKFKDGCGRFVKEGDGIVNFDGYYCCLDLLCPNCQRIHKSWERINGNS